MSLPRRRAIGPLVVLDAGPAELPLPREWRAAAALRWVIGWYATGGGSQRTSFQPPRGFALLAYRSGLYRLENLRIDPSLSHVPPHGDLAEHTVLARVGGTITGGAVPPGTGQRDALDGFWSAVTASALLPLSATGVARLLADPDRGVREATARTLLPLVRPRP